MNIDHFRVISLTVNILCIIITLLLMMLYYPKKKILTKENNIYSILLFITFSCLIMELIFYGFSYNVKNIDLTTTWERIYFCLITSWMLLHTIYIFVITNNNYFKKVKYKAKRIVIISSMLLLNVFVFLLPIEHTIEDGNLIASSGPALIYIFLLNIFLILFEVVLVVSFRKKISKSKTIPLCIFLIIIASEVVLNILGLKLMLITLPMTLVSFLMYHTIENPDVKMIQQLNIAKDQAEKANNAKTDFLSNMSHEIRTPLNAIVGFSNLLLDDETVPDKAKEEVKDIIMASDNLLEIVNGILDISKIEANKIEIVNSEYDFNKLTKELIALTNGRIGEKPLEFKVDIAPDIPRVLYGDVQRIKQICVNILTNAVKYTKEGWVELKISCVKKDNVCRLIVTVEDTGIGIKEGSIGKLFDRFERIDMEQNMTIEGTGLGLAITKKLLDLMGGKIVVQSVFGKGSKFTVAVDQGIVENPTITLDQDEVKKDEHHEKLEINKSVLLVDDNKINLKVAERLLETYGLKTDSVESGFECLEKINNGNKYDLILLDDMMPKMSGVETLQKLKEIEGFNVPVIALTANALTGMKEKYLASGFNDYLAKPIDKAELNRVINEYLNDK